ncbi:MAG TPA: CheR family methyltransferase [Burkholderiaceae bacterium]|nr:CheR family methyltransferase [Burkholderiaceae bacterium]
MSEELPSTESTPAAMHDVVRTDLRGSVPLLPESGRQFFAQPGLYEELVKRFPAVLQRRQDDAPLRVWVTGCAICMEAYSVAMTLLQQLEACHFRGSLQVFATDSDVDALAVAKRGIFSQSALGAMRSDLIEHFFTRLDDTRWRVRTPLRERIVFGSHDLLADPPLSKLDLVICQGALGALDANSRDAALLKLHFALRPGAGHLALGPSEGIGERSKELFDCIPGRWPLYRRKETPEHRRAGPSAIRAAVDSLAKRPGSVQERPRRSPETSSTADVGANEEHQIALEEISAMNEVLRFANEELVASERQLRSLNGELEGAYSQLRARARETERARADLANFVASVELPAIYIGRDRAIGRFTPAAARLFGLRPTDSGRALSGIALCGLDARLGEEIDAVLATRVPRVRELSGPGGWYLRRIAPYWTERNCVDGVVVTFTDVTTLKQAEKDLRAAARDREARAQAIEKLLDQHGRAQEALRVEHGFLAAVLDNAAILVTVLDASRRVVRFNAACERASGNRSEEVVGKSFWELGALTPDQVPLVRRVFERLCAGEAVVQWEGHFRARDGALLPVAWCSSALRERGEVQYFINVGIDQTEQRAAEDMLRERTEQLAHLHRRHTASRLAEIIAHELGQPLVAITSYAEACLQGARAGNSSPVSLASNIEKISVQALRAGRFVNSLRRMIARGDAGLRTESLNDIVRASLEIVAPIARRGNVRVQLHLDEQLPPVRCSSIQIEHVIGNLLRNALQAVSDGPMQGEIRVATGARQDGMAEVVVADNGPGVAPEAVGKVFDPFYTTRTDGLGLGLAICRTMVEAHGGRIWAEPGPGGRFLFSLCLADAT